jgi:hypothetical protein
MKGLTMAAVSVVYAVAISSCGKPPEGSPASARTPVASTPDGLVSLFKRECLAWTDLLWARAESKRIVATCGGLLVGDGERGDCEQGVAGDVSWLVPTTSKSTVMVHLFWGDNPSRISCSTSVAKEMEVVMRQAAAQVASDRSLHVSSQSPTTVVWSADAGPAERLTLLHHGPELADVRFDTLGQWAARGAALQRQHPVELSYQPPGAAPPPTD